MRALRFLNPNALIRLSAERPPALPSHSKPSVSVRARPRVFVDAAHEKSSAVMDEGVSSNLEFTEEDSN